jgi:hypothetical protein
MISFSRFIGNVRDGWAISKARSSCAICICCTVGSSRGGCTVDKDDRELPVGDNGTGVLDTSMCRTELLHLSAYMMRMMQISPHIVSFARGFLPSTECWYPGCIRPPTVAQIFALTSGISQHDTKGGCGNLRQYFLSLL